MMTKHLQHSIATHPLALAASALLGLTCCSHAQIFTYKDSDLCAGFRKVTALGNYEAVVNLGQASNFVNAAIGTTNPITAYTIFQLIPGCFTASTNLTWSVFGYHFTSSTAYPGYPNGTLWITVPRTSNNMRSSDAARQNIGMLNAMKYQMQSILDGTKFISKDLATATVYNATNFVRESTDLYGGHLYSDLMASQADSTLGTLGDTWLDSNLEITTPGVFTGSVRSDLYEVRPLTTSGGTVITDPHTGTNGLAYYVGYFEFKADGTMSFVREAVSTAVTPTPVTLYFGRTNSVNTISFQSSNIVTYTLLFTNSAGLSAAASTWPALPGTIAGDGTVKSFTDTTTTSNRFYRVKAQ
jgi:hypothetical protein